MSGFCFFFQAEDGIRDWSVTGVQTCALPICRIATSTSRRESIPTNAFEASTTQSAVWPYRNKYFCASLISVVGATVRTGEDIQDLAMLSGEKPESDAAIADKSFCSAIVFISSKSQSFFNCTLARALIFDSLPI